MGEFWREKGMDGIQSADDSISRTLAKTWCHQCKMRKQRVTACDNFFSPDKEIRCNGRYCDACIQRHYGEDASRFVNLREWKCYRCTGRCTCAACKRRRKADDEGEDMLVEPEPRKREARVKFRYNDDVPAYDDEDFEPVKKRHSTVETRPHTRPVPLAPKMEARPSVRIFRSEEERACSLIFLLQGMSALAMLA